MGKPTSEERKKLDMLDKCVLAPTAFFIPLWRPSTTPSSEHHVNISPRFAAPLLRFKKAHPELDFSNVKMS
jgi:hypothetical protein